MIIDHYGVVHAEASVSGGSPVRLCEAWDMMDPYLDGISLIDESRCSTCLFCMRVLLLPRNKLA